MKWHCSQNSINAVLLVVLSLGNIYLCFSLAHYKFTLFFRNIYVAFDIQTIHSCCVLWRLCRASRASHRSHEPSSLVAFRNFEEEMRQPGVWESEQGAASTAEASRDNLASLYRPPFHLMFNGPFDKVNMLLSLDFMDFVKVEISQA